MFRSSAILILCATLVSCAGCRSRLGDSRCERETALLRAEILDLEDKYYALQAQQQSAVGGSQVGMMGTTVGNGVIVNQGFVDQGFVDQGYVDQGMINSYQSPVMQGEIIYDDMAYGGQTYLTQPNVVPYSTQAMAEGAIDINGQPIISSNQIYYENGAIIPTTNAAYDNSVLLGPNSGAPVDDSGIQSLDSYESIEPTPAQSQGTEQTTPNPDANDQTYKIPPLDSPEFEISFQDDDSEPIITHIEINTSASRGEDIDGRPGDDGLNLLIETKTEFGESVEGTGTVNVVVSDPAIASGANQIGQWTFLPEETELFLSRDEFDQRGILLHLPWTDQTPRSSLITINVTFETSDGRQLQTATTLEVTPPPVAAKADANLVTGWTARDKRWVTDPEHNMAAGPRLNPSSPIRNSNQLQNQNQNQWQSQGRGQFIRRQPTRRDSVIRSASPMQGSSSVQPPEWKPVR